MSTDPKRDLLRKSGPLGFKSSVPEKTVEDASPTQAAILYQNEEQISKIDILTGKVEQGFQGAHGRMDRMERIFNDRLVLVEKFIDRLSLLPKALWALVGVLGVSGIETVLKWLHSWF